MPRVHRHSQHTSGPTSTPAKTDPAKNKATTASTTSTTSGGGKGKVVFQDGFDMSRSTDTTQNTALTLQQLAQKAAALTDVPGRVQEGPTCGLYALGMVMDFWDSKDSKNLNPLVQDGDKIRWDAKNRPADTAKELLPSALKDGYTTKGEMFTADQLGKLATEFGYQYKLTQNASLKDLQAALKRGHPVLVAFDVDFQGNPGRYGGERAHWCVVEGMFTKGGEKYVVAKHAWDGKDRVWNASDLLESMSQLHHSDFWGGEKDISAMLDDKMVEVYPAGR
jgi:hypothetical protein